VGKPLPRVVIDTNVLMVSISRRSALYWLYAAFLEDKFLLCVTNAIMTEYAEIMTRHMGADFCDTVLDLIQSAPNTRLISPTYRFNLLLDPDDNKFVDCAIVANAVCIVSHDRDFRVLQTIDFPKVNIVDTRQFRALLLGVEA